MEVDNMKNKNIALSSNEAKYKNARISLLTIVILSAVNLFSIVFSDSYFLFSAYLPQILIYSGYDLYSQSGMQEYLIVAMVFAAIVIIPYLLAFIFSKKRVGWLVAALVMFSLDSILFLWDFIYLISAGYFDGILDLIIRIWAIGSLILGVRYGFLAKKEAATAHEEASDTLSADQGEEYAVQETRTVTVTRKKAYAGCAVAVVCHINGREVCTLKNGETKSFAAPVGEFTLSASLSNGFGAGEIVVPPVVRMEYDLKVKMGLAASKIVITPTEGF